MTNPETEGVHQGRHCRMQQLQLERILQSPLAASWLTECAILCLVTLLLFFVCCQTGLCRRAHSVAMSRTAHASGADHGHGHGHAAPVVAPPGEVCSMRFYPPLREFVHLPPFCHHDITFLCPPSPSTSLLNRRPCLCLPTLRRLAQTAASGGGTTSSEFLLFYHLSLHCRHCRALFRGMFGSNETCR